MSDVSKDTYEIHVAIVRRMVQLAEKQGIHAYDSLQLSTTLFYVEDCNLNPRIDWQGLLDAPDGDFAHDVHGMHKHASRGGKDGETGFLTDCFSPRFAISE